MKVTIANDEHTFKNIVDSLPDIIFRINSDFRHLYVNPSIEKLTGISAEALIGKTTRELGMDPEVCASWEEKLLRVFRKGQELSFGFEFHGETEVKYFQSNLIPELDADGKVASVLGICRDVTNHKTMLEVAAIAEAKFTRVFNLSPAAMAIRKLPELSFVEVNETWIRETGFCREEVIGKTANELNLIDNYLLWCEQNKDKNELRSGLQEVSYSTKSGKIKEVLWAFRIIYIGEAEYIVTAFIDISEKKRMEKEIALLHEQVAASEKKYRELVEAANVIIMHLDGTGKILFMNEFGLEYFGYAASELLNHSFKEKLIPQLESTGRDLWQAFGETFFDKDNHAHHVLENVKKDGRRVWVEWTNRFGYDSSTKELRVVSIGMDISSRRRAETLLKVNYERRRRNELLTDVLQSRITEEAFWDLAKQEGLTISSPLFCSFIVLGLDTIHQKFPSPGDMEQWHAWLDTAADIIKTRFGGVAWPTEQGIAVLQPGAKYSGAAYAGWGDSLLGVARDCFRGSTFTIGISSIHSEIRTTFRQAKDAAFAGPIFHPDQAIYYWRDLGVCRLILEQANSGGAKLFVKEWLGPLCDSQTSKNREWLETLQEVVTGDALTVIANRLHIHPKTLSFRIKKIEQLLKVSLDDSETRLSIAVALKLKKLHEKTIGKA